MAASIGIVSSASCQEVAERRAAREAELQRLALAAVNTRQNNTRKYGEWSIERKSRVADLLAFIGVIHDTPTAKGDWINW